MEDDILYLDRPGGPSLAYCYTPAKPGVKGTTIVFLPGYMSDMEGGKALAVDAWAKQQGRAMLRLDYAGCGASGGEFEDQSLIDWRDDVLFLIDKVTSGSITLIGSSMGGWLMLLTALARFPDVIASAAQDLAPHRMAFYLKDELADAFHSYYNAHKFLVDDAALQAARLALCEATRLVLGNGLALLGVSAPERM